MDPQAINIDAAVPADDQTLQPGVPFDGQIYDIEFVTDQWRLCWWNREADAWVCADQPYNMPTEAALRWRGAPVDPVV